MRARNFEFIIRISKINESLLKKTIPETVEKFRSHILVPDDYKSRVKRTNVPCRSTLRLSFSHKQL